MARLTVKFLPEDLRGGLQIPLTGMKGLDFPGRFVAVTLLHLVYPYQNCSLNGHFLLQIRGATNNTFRDASGLSIPYSWALPEVYL